MTILAAVTWSAAGFHAISSASIVVASYFTAWITRMQHRLLLFFRSYGGQVLEDDEAREAPSDAEIEQEQERRVQSTTGNAWGDPTPPTPPNLFGGRPPKGQA